MALQTQIEELKAQLPDIAEDHRLPFEKKLKEDMDKLSAKLKQGKIAKFKRELNDYSTGTIYDWGKKRNRRHRKVSFNVPSTDEEDGDDTKDIKDSGRIAETLDAHDFLEFHPRQHSQFYRTGRGKRGGAGGDGCPFRSPATRSQWRHPQ